MYMECRHIKTNGCKCQSPALCGMSYCYFHMRLHRAAHGQNGESGAAIEMPVVEDRTSVQLALTRILQEMAARRLKPRDARLFLYGLQIASQIADPPRLAFKDDLVQSLTTNKDGEEIGPDEYVCDDDDDCNECPYSEVCPRSNAGDDDEEDGDDSEEDADGK